MGLRRAGIALALAALVPSAGAGAQKASEAASVSQTVGDAKVTVEYSRPRARGRTGLFGNTVKWERTWTPGANRATTLDVSRDVTIEGVPVPKGRYSVWIKVVEGPWEVLLDKDTTRWHTQPPRAGAEAVRIPVRREARPFVEVLTWSFPEVDADGTTLLMQWDTVAVPLHVATGSPKARATEPEVARRVVGRYDLRWTPESGMMVDDTTRAPGDSAKRVPMRNTFTIRYEGGELRAVMDPPMTRRMPGFTDWLIVKAKKDYYNFGRLLNGQLMAIDKDNIIHFDIVDGQARGFEVRSPSDELQATATRLPDAK